MDTPGRMIVLCGIDGSGKTAQSQMLCERLRRAGKDVKYVEFPRYSESFFGDLIARYLRGEFSSRAGEVDPHLASLPFACDRWEARPMLKQSLEAGKVVVCNRYVSANLAHQGGKLESMEEKKGFRKWAEKMEYEVFKIPRPDLHVWLDVPAKLALGLIANKGERDYLEGDEDIHEKDLDHLQTTRAMYEMLAEEDDGWRTVDCAPAGEVLSKDSIAGLVWEAVCSVLPDEGRKKRG